MCARCSCRYCLLRWRQWIRPLVLTVYAVILLALLPLLIVQMIQHQLERTTQGWLIGGLFTLLTLPISLWEIIQHLVHYTKPSLQKHIVRILWMVPIYSLNAFLGLVYPDNAIYMDSIRECYEAYVIYNFMMYLLSYLSAEMDLEATLELKLPVKHIFPLCCIRPWVMGREFVHKCRHGILQYTVIRPLTTAISFVCELAGVYGEGEFKATKAFPYLIAVNNLSQFVAMYCLVLFYRATREELKPMKPLAKFLCIKAVIFFSFFQGVLIAIFVYSGIIHVSIGDESHTQSVKNISASLQDFIICIEMFIAAVAHHYAFSYRPYVDMASEQQGCLASFLEMFDVSDIHRDVREHMHVVKNTVKRGITSKPGVYKYPGGTQDECSMLLSDPAANDNEPGPSPLRRYLSIENDTTIIVKSVQQDNDENLVDLSYTSE